MKLFRLSTPVEAGGDLISMGDRQGRLLSYFISNTGDGKFLNFVKLRAEAQDLISADDVAAADYLHGDIGIPIFSQKARNVFAAELPGELEFHPITVLVADKEFSFFLAKALKYLDIIDSDNSSFRALPDGAPILQGRAVYKQNFDEEFGIARDKNYTSRLVVTEKFVEISQRHHLNILFEEPL